MFATPTAYRISQETYACWGNARSRSHCATEGSPNSKIFKEQHVNFDVKIFKATLLEFIYTVYREAV